MKVFGYINQVLCHSTEKRDHSVLKVFLYKVKTVM